MSLTIVKSEGVKYSDYQTLLWIQEIICNAIEKYPVGKIIIDAEKITFYKFGMKMCTARLVANGVVYNNGKLSFRGLTITPIVRNEKIFQQLLDLFNLRNW